MAKRINNKGYYVETIYGKEVVLKNAYNLARMSTWEYYYYSIFQWGVYGQAFGKVCEQVILLLESLLYLVVYLVMLILLPITLIFHSKNTVKRAKKG